MTPPALTRLRLLPQLLQDHTEASPQAIGCIDGSSSMTYSELAAQSASIATALCESEATPGDVVGVFMSPSNRLLAATWGILRSGAAYLPLAVDYPLERVRYMIVDSGLRHIVVDRESHATLEMIVPNGVNVLKIEDMVDTPPASEVSWIAADSPAYVIYTSGSTGRPKGVVISHGALSRQLEFLSGRAGLSPDSRVLLKTPTSFDAAQWELLANAAGATVVVAGPGVHREPEKIVDLVNRHSVSILQCVPTLWNALLETKTLSSCHSLSELFSGGEVLPSVLARQILEALPEARLTNLYGPTETTINATWNRIGIDDLPDKAAVGIGESVPSCNIHILNDHLAEVSDGQVGELCISGEQLAIGYLNKPALTAERFVEAFIDGSERRIYRTGDLARIDSEGSLEFCGRADDQVKVNGHRVETDEVKLAIESHHWVRQAAVVPYRQAPDGTMHLGAFIELDSEEAALMDQGTASEHHRSKRSHVQVKAQLAQLAVRQDEVRHQDRVALPNPEGTHSQRLAAFARKTYRHFEGSPLDKDELLIFCDLLKTGWPLSPSAGPMELGGLSDLLRWLGPFPSPDRLLPKFAYASPGALNATRIYVETNGIVGLRRGIYYFHPFEHELHRITESTSNLGDVSIRLHLVGLPEVIEAVYSTNVLEVLNMEAGHIAGALDRAAAQHGYHLRTIAGTADAHFEIQDSWVRTVVFDLAPGVPEEPQYQGVDLTLQIHGKVAGLKRGSYRVEDDSFIPVNDAVIERRHVIAINQATYDRSVFGVTLSSNSSHGWAGFVSLGRALQKLQMNRQGVGLMSSGYASLSGRNLPSALRFNEIMSTSEGAEPLTYFAVGGPISHVQTLSTGMKEDSVHVSGPTEILKDDLRRQLPYYMVPSRIEVLDRLPRASTSKVDRTALIGILESSQGRQAEVIPPASALEVEVLAIASDILDVALESVSDDFFHIGGNSLSAVRFINALNTRFGAKIPVQQIFEAPTVRGMAAYLSAATPVESSRIVRLAAGHGEPIYIWPGLGGYPMNLRALAAGVSTGRPVYGIQALGLNAGEVPYATLEEMVRADAELIHGTNNDQGVTLMGYSFGSRMAAEVACLLEDMGVVVDHLDLIAPGSPRINGTPEPIESLTFSDPYFRMILMSVFKGNLEGLPEDGELDAIRDELDFLELLASRMPSLDAGLAERIVRVVLATYEFRSGPMRKLDSMMGRTRVLVASGDGDSFIAPYRADLELLGAVSELQADHYQILREPSVEITSGMILAGRSSRT